MLDYSYSLFVSCNKYYQLNPDFAMSQLKIFEKLTVINSWKIKPNELAGIQCLSIMVPSFFPYRCDGIRTSGKIFRALTPDSILEQ